MTTHLGLRAKEPNNAHGGLSVSEFTSPGIRTAVRQSIHLLPAGKRRLLYLGAAAQVSLGVLDLIGIGLIGLVAATAVSGLGVTSLPPAVASFLAAIGLNDVTQLSVALALAAVILVGKTILSAFMTRRITVFLAPPVEALRSRATLSRPLAQVQRWSAGSHMLLEQAAAATLLFSVLRSLFALKFSLRNRQHQPLHL